MDYDNAQSRAFCAEKMTTVNLVAASDHKSNGPIENANQTLLSYYNRICLCDSRSTNETILGESLNGNKKSRESNKASAFELRYNRSPRMIPEIIELCSPSI